ncbi:HNH endonuclease, partial [Citrobacter farmeri]
MTTKVKVKKTRAERKQHSRDMQAKHEAEKKAANLRNILKRDILATLGIPKNHGGRAALSTFITEHLLKGESQVQIVAMLTGSELMKRAQLAEIERLKKITELANQTRRNEITNRAFERLGITTRHPMGDLVLSMVRELANQNLNTGEIVERLNDNETVLESRRLHKEKRADLERQIDEGIAERKKTRVDMREVLAYMAQKNGTTYTPPADTWRSPEHPNGDSPTRHNGKIRESRLTGAEST